MNICFLTAQLVTCPKKCISKTGQDFIRIYLRIPNPKKGKSFYYIKCRTKEIIHMQLLHWYQKGDYVILEGNLKFNYIKLKKRKSKNLEVNILRDFPASLDM
uniref:Putative single-stranded DNA binding protein n=1 Tax=Kumanoa americana TaxID=1196377 RepID=A0A1C9CGJ6_9FLOR|nr:putative single-stranded DNA binding protein [Kumanoa americana]AOM67487.1 putative single-stranded DNA binding protein [Kumanoa americana]